MGELASWPTDGAHGLAASDGVSGDSGTLTSVMATGPVPPVSRRSGSRWRRGKASAPSAVVAPQVTASVRARSSSSASDVGGPVAQALGLDQHDLARPPGAGR